MSVLTLLEPKNVKLNTFWFQKMYSNELFQEFKGALTENYVSQELVHSHYSLFYWTSEGKAELDFIFEHEGLIFPLEVKSGNSSKKRV